MKIHVVYKDGAVVRAFVGEQKLNDYVNTTGHKVETIEQSYGNGLLIDEVELDETPDIPPPFGEPIYVEIEFNIKVRRELKALTIPGDDLLNQVGMVAQRFGHDFYSELKDAIDDVHESTFIGFLVLDNQGRKVELE